LADADLPIRNTRHHDPLDDEIARVGAGTPLGFGESVDPFNGNLHIEHASSPSFPFDGGNAFGLSRSYDSGRVVRDEVETGPSTSGYATRGVSWVGLGWKSHFGRFVGARLYGGSPTYGIRKYFFETPSGEMLPVRWDHLNKWYYSQKRAIEIRVEYYESCPMPPWHGNPAPCCSTNPPKCDGPPLCEPPPDRCVGRPTEDHPNAAHYQLTMPGGTRYLLEKIVNYELDATTDYVKNADRAGWYPTRITDISGNWIKIEYYRSENPNFPEAIKRIHSSSRPTTAGTPAGTLGSMDITTELCTSVIAGQCPQSAQGMLKKVIATGFKGSRSSPQVLVQEFFYKEEELYDTINPTPGLTNKRRVALLWKVKTTGLEGATPTDGGTIEYVYGDPDATSPNPQRPALLEKIIYPPFSAVSSYSYGTLNLGARQPYPAPTATLRTSLGVTARVLYPDGEPTGGGFANSARWQWSRTYSLPAGETQCSSTAAPLNSFVTYDPLRNKTEVKYGGHVCGLTGDEIPSPSHGVPYQTIVYGQDGGAESSWPKIRTEDLSYDGTKEEVNGQYLRQILQQSITTIHDDVGLCFGSTTDMFGAHQQRLVYSQRVGHRWKESSLEAMPDLGLGSPPIPGYFKKKANGDLDAHATRTTTTGMSGCLFTLNIPEQTERVDVVEGGKKARTTYSYYCNTSDTHPDRPKSGLVKTATVYRDFFTGADPTDTSPLVTTVGYTAQGDQTSASTSGGDTVGDGTASNSYGRTLTTDRGRAVSATIDGLPGNYKVLDLTYDGSTGAGNGVVWKSRDASQFETVFDFDSLGRPTKTTPPAPAASTRIDYVLDATTNTTRISSLTPGEGSFSPSDPNQFFAESVLDRLGRMIEARRVLPDGSISIQITRYDELGRAVFVSEWMSQSEYQSGSQFSWSVDRDGAAGAEYQISGIPGTTSAPLGTTFFYGAKKSAGDTNPLNIVPDALGRLVRVERGGQPISEVAYCGPHQEISRWVDRDADGTAASTEVSKTRLYHDGLGRLVVVDVQPFAGDPACEATDQNVAADAVYEYNPLSQLTKATIGPCLDTTPYSKWRNGNAWKPNTPTQVREWIYDAAGLLRSRSIPEESETRFYDAYDAAGNLLAWRDPLGVARGYHFRSTFDQAGRLKSVSRIEGVPDTAADTDLDTLGNAGSFENDLTGWETGTLDGSFQFTAGTNYWRVMTGTACGIGPPSPPPPITGSAPASQKWLYFGSSPSCSYGANDASGNSPNGTQVVRKYVTGVTRDHVLTFQYFRQVREGSSSLDNFTVYLVQADSTTNNMAARRRIFHLDGLQPSYSTWTRLFDLRPGDLYSEAEWPEGTSTKNFYLLFVFAKGDTASSSLGTGVALDNVFLGRRGVERQAELFYDEKHCSSLPTTDLRSETCADGYETSDRSEGKLTSIIGYQSDVATDRRRLVYRGLAGSLSGEEHAIDWRGVEYLNLAPGTTWVTRQRLDTLGRGYQIVAPYNPSYDTLRRYEYTFKRESPVQIRETQQGVDFLKNTPPTDFTRTGALKNLRLANGTTQTFGFDTINRLQNIASAGPTGLSYWNSGTYQIDPSGTITGIGTNRYAYDSAGRLIQSFDTSSANSSGAATTNTVNYKYDPFGNTLRSDPANAQNPIGLDATYSYDYSNPSRGNRIATIATDLVTTPVNVHYDRNGNMTRFLDALDTMTAAAWNPANQMAAYFTAIPEGPNGGYPAETYLYDASRLRTVRHRHTVGSGESASEKYVELTLRDGSGSPMSRYIYKPTLGRAVLDKDFVYGFGRLLVERDVTEQFTTASAGSSVRTGSDWNMSTSSGAGTYAGDVTTAGGSTTYLPAITVGTNGLFTIAESSLQAGTTNLVRIKKEGAEDLAYSAPVALFYTNSLTSSSPNQVRGITVSRSGNTISVRWDLQNENGKNFVIKFKRADTGGIYTLTPVGLGSSVRELSLTSQALASPCGSFHISQYQHPNIGIQTDPTGDVDLPNPEGGSAGRLTCGGGGGGTPPPGSYTWVNRWHHRDHLSSLRVVTSESGSKEEGNDYYPYGLELLPDSGVIGSRSWAKFTVHMRDKQTGIDDMKMRAKGSRYGSFASADLVDDVALGAPLTWNKFSYVRSSPLMRVDPLGLMSLQECRQSGGTKWSANSGLCLIDGVWVLEAAFVTAKPTIKADRIPLPPNFSDPYVRLWPDSLRGAGGTSPDQSSPTSIRKARCIAALQRLSRGRGLLVRSVGVGGSASGSAIAGIGGNLLLGVDDEGAVFFSRGGAVTMGSGGGLSGFGVAWASTGRASNFEGWSLDGVIGAEGGFKIGAEASLTRSESANLDGVPYYTGALSFGPAASAYAYGGNGVSYGVQLFNIYEILCSIED
jgi:RHS repeat-associated protein